MGLSTKQVSGDHGLDWSQALLQSQSFELPKPPAMMRRQQNQEQPEQLKCPRCESTNTKFCYYNNYNKTQPRHFCRACKRHWTKGGTLRNVPVGGHGRKNKRARKSSSAAKTNSSNGGASTTNIASTTTRLINSNTNLSFDMGALLPPQINSISSSELDNHVFSSSGLSSSNLTTNLPFNFFQAGGGQVLSFPFSSSSTTSSSFDTISTSFQSPNVYNYAQEFKSMEEPTATLTTSTSIITQPNVSGSGVDAPNDSWNWEDIETLVSTDLNVPWGDSDVNP